MQRAAGVRPCARRRRSAWREAQQPADDRRVAGLGLGVDLEGELAASERRAIERAAPQTGVCLGKIEEAAVGQELVELEREALARAVRPLNDEGAACRRYGSWESG